MADGCFYKEEADEIQKIFTQGKTTNFYKILIGIVIFKTNVLS